MSEETGVAPKTKTLKQQENSSLRSSYWVLSFQ